MLDANQRLHVTSGDAAAGMLKQDLGIPGGAILVHRDVLSCGPLARFESLSSWREARYGFWQASTDARINPPASQDLLWEAERLRDAAEVWLWLGTALSDQLLLALTVHLFDHLGVDLARLRTVQIDPARGVGELRPEALRSHPAPLAMTNPRAEHARWAWQASTADGPDALLAFLAGAAQGPANPHLQHAMHAWLDRFPDRRSGLGRWDETLLAACDAVPRSAGQIVGTALGARRADLDVTGDSYLGLRLRRLGAADLASPAITLAGDVFDLKACQVALTDAGRAICAGSASFLTLNQDALSADDWIGAVHLRPRDRRVWFRDGHGGLIAG